MAVYDKYYLCEREPFSLSPDPGFLYSSAGYREALAQLHYLIQQRKGLATITGEVGTGKTLLLRSLIEGVGPEVHTCFIFDPPRSRYELYEMIADELDISPSAVGNPVSKLNRHLLAVAENGGTVVLIFDEAQLLQTAMLEEIRLLTNLETSNAKLVQVVMAGQPEFDAAIDSVELRALRQRLIFRIALKPLDAGDTMGYIEARIATAGATRSPFTARACHAVHRYSRGVPRLVNVICDNAMLAGYALDNSVIEDSLIDEIAADLMLVERAAPHRKPPLIGASPALFSRRMLHFGFATVWLVFGIGLTVIAALTGQTGASSSPLNQLQDWLKSTLHWLGRTG
jgi:general secretion pathway protein A